MADTSDIPEPSAAQEGAGVEATAVATEQAATTEASTSLEAAAPDADPAEGATGDEPAPAGSDEGEAEAGGSQAAELADGEDDTASPAEDNNPYRRPAKPAPKRVVRPTFKTGDWFCQVCGTHNFSRRPSCVKCYEMKAVPRHIVAYATKGKGKGYMPPARGGKGSKGQGEAGCEWYCPMCRQVNQARMLNCKKCFSASPFAPPPKQQGSYSSYPSYHGHTAPQDMEQEHLPMWDDMAALEEMYHGYGPAPATYGGYGGPAVAHSGGKGDFAGQWSALKDMPGDWDCWVCGHLNGERRGRCKVCQIDKGLALPRSGGASPRPGDWFCMECQVCHMRVTLRAV
eukprot:TRINITY_DN13449_c0_g1_i1.p1 TRINITY_DN13449_c0_g1~~TRINITY_DN13449_c0_g1_i1.p1  ORF type:complete len:342 (+),score=66.49 TRINITY_DN13449_c0_g1_i1:1255-2280(+)